jgi:hypothetical protein
MFLEFRDFIGLLILAIMLLTPLVSIYLTLETLNWNEGKNLFSISWAVFFVWLVSSFSAVLICALVDHKFRLLNDSNFYFFLIPSTAILNIFSIAGFFSLKSRDREKGTFVIDSSEIENSRKVNNRNIFQTSVIISIITLSIVMSLFLFLKNVEPKIQRLMPKNESDIFTVYD